MSDQDKKAEYYQSISQMAREIVEQCKRSDEDVSNMVHKAANSSYWVIYTHANLQAIQASDNWLAYDDDCGDDLGSSFYTCLTRVVYYAVVADINHEIARIEQEEESDDE